MKKIICLLLPLIMLSHLSFAQSSKNNQMKAYFYAAQGAYENQQYDDALTAIDKVESLLGNTNAQLSALKVKTYFKKNQFIKAKAEMDVFFGFTTTEVLAREVSSYLIQIDKGIKEEKVQLEKEKNRLAGHQNDKPDIRSSIEKSTAALNVQPIIRIDPKYPRQATVDGIEGWVKLSFSINELGGVADVKIVEAMPRRIFDKESMRALKKWKYRPKIVGGKAQKQQGLTVTLTFSMQK